MHRDDELERSGGASEFRVRARFYAIRQVDGERAYDWYRRARTAAVPCGFADDRPVADKFVTGLRPGPVADRLLGERADVRLVDLVAAAVRAEGAAAAAARRSAAATPPPAIPPARPTPSLKTGDVLDEIREVLKLYRYGNEDATPSDSGDHHPSLINHHTSLAANYVNTLIDDTSSTTTLDGNSWWKNRIEKSYKHETTENKNKYSPLTCKSCCNLATTLLDSFCINTPSLFLQPLPNTNGNSKKYLGNEQDHDDSNCYCSSLTSDEYKEIDYRTTSKSIKTSSPNSRHFGCPTKVQCCVCDSDDKSFSQ